MSTHLIDHLTVLERVKLVDAALASLNAEIGDPNLTPGHMDEELGITLSFEDEARDALERCCDAWDEFANQVEGFRDA